MCTERSKYLKMEKIKLLYQRYRELINYLFFGVLTTVVNYVTYLALAPFFTFTTVPTVVAWILSVLFAYLTNRRYVFCSHTVGKDVLKEASGFFMARVMSGVLDVAIMWVFVDLIGFNDLLIKLLSNVVVVVFNYIASKMVVFSKKKSK